MVSHSWYVNVFMKATLIKCKLRLFGNFVIISLILDLNSCIIQTSVPDESRYLTFLLVPLSTASLISDHFQRVHQSESQIVANLNKNMEKNNHGFSVQQGRQVNAWYVQINSEEIIPSNDSCFRLYPESLFKFIEESLRIRWSSLCPLVPRNF